MSEQDKQQLGDGSTNYADAAQKTAKAIKEAGKAVAEKTAAAAGEATANTTAAVAQAGVEGGKAVAEVATGTAAGGPWGAIIAAAWALRKPIFKVLICIGLVILFFIMAVVTLPSIISNNLFHTDPSTVDPDGAVDLIERADDMSDVVAACIQNGYDAALARVEQIIEENGYDYETSVEALINYGSLNPDYEVCYVFAAYSASMGQVGTSEADMRRKLDAVAEQMFKVTYVEKEFERVIPLTYSTYTPVTLTVVTGKTKIGEVNGVPKYSYATATRTYYVPSGEGITETEIQRTAYSPVSVDIPVYSRGIIVGVSSETYYAAGDAETLTPDTEIVKYAECTIAPFNEGVIYTAFDIDPDAIYEETTGTTYGAAIKTMADALKMTLYGTLAAGDIPELTSEELIGIVDGLNTTDARKKLIETALSLVGKVSYFWGGKSPAGWNNDWGKPKKVTGSGSVTSGTIRPYGLDCSGFADWVYKTALGRSIGTGSANQWSKSTEISASELLPGDLGFKAKPSDPGTNHVLMYVGLTSDGKRQWAHCSSSKGGVVLNTPSYVKYYRRPNGIDYSSPAGGCTGDLGTPLYTLKVNVTHYCACSKCCGKNADGITASGKRVAPGMVAMSGHYPFGTVLVINGEVYTVEDRGGSGIENDIARVDIYVEDHKQALRLGRYWAEATFYRIGR